jgi:hypothetical protein
MRKRWLGAALVVAGVLQAGTASAITAYYTDFYTSNLLFNKHGNVTLPGEITNISTLMSLADVDIVGSGLGSGLVTTSSPLSVVHSFAPDTAVGSILGATLKVSVMDDSDLFQTEKLETASIQIGATELANGSASFNLFGIDVSAYFDAAGDTATFSYKATKGDYKVLFSALTVKFDAAVTPRVSPPAATPEPTAALVFALGVALVARMRPPLAA